MPELLVNIQQPSRLNRSARLTLAAFAATVRNETDLDALTAALVRVIQETIEPELVSVWLKLEDLRRLAPSYFPSPPARTPPGNV